ncbi:DUF2188 domain-containing protein [Sediminibacillus massiliensis]|uniref:DUF2188 domain-containing protein n=1 Tax=Sediminibacillus massiliensis TaxID=1926277 RepID=UPI0009885EED|nr:DUF2188 domain-containing protein [Sediminibacillus massiliensis]
MKEYTVTPDKDASNWYVKIEDVAPTDLYSKKDDAIEQGKKMAEENKPSRLMILDENKDVVDELRYS